MKVTCTACKENLDDRDIVKQKVICWKCGCKMDIEATENSEDENDEEEWYWNNPTVVFDFMD